MAGAALHEGGFSRGGITGQACISSAAGGPLSTDEAVSELAVSAALAASSVDSEPPPEHPAVKTAKATIAVTDFILTIIFPNELY